MTNRLISASYWGRDLSNDMVNVLIAVLIILILSFILAIRSVGKEFTMPAEVKSIRIKKREKLKGVILFLQEKIIHHQEK